MKKTLIIIRVFFFLLCVAGGVLVWYANRDWEEYFWLCLISGALLGGFTILVDIVLKGFSLRGLTALSFGLAIGALIAFLLAKAPFFDPIEDAFPETVYMVRLILFVLCMYLATVLALRGRDEFNLVIPYIRFVPHDVTSPLVVVDTSALIDGRIVDICRSHFLSSALVIPRFVLDELHKVANSTDPSKRNRGRKGLETLNALKSLPDVDLRIEESEVKDRELVDDKLVFLAKSLKARILTTDYNLSQLARFQGVEWLNLNALATALIRDVSVGDNIEIELVRQGREKGQGVGYLNDGSMVVVNDSEALLGSKIWVEIISIIPSAGGKMIFANVIQSPLRLDF